MNKQSHPIFDREALARNLELDDSALLQELYGDYLTQIDDMAKAFARSSVIATNRSDIALFAHRLKSSSEAVGAAQLSYCLRMLEQAAVNNTPELGAIFSTAQLLIAPTRAAIQSEIIRLSRTEQQ